MSTEDIIKLGLLGAIAYFVYSYFSSPNNPLTGTNSVASGAANLWLTLFPLPPTMSVQGNLVLAAGSLVPISQVQIKTDSVDNVYALWSGHVYQLQPSDANGNWPATLVA
jgi:hypothetical protein